MAITLNSKEYNVAGNQSQVVADFTFDSSYSYGGEAFDPSPLLGLQHIQRASFEPIGGYSFVYDSTNKKIKAYKEAPPIVFSEVQTIADSAITLDYPPALIMSISSASGPYYLTTSGATLTTDQCKPSAIFAKGERTTISFEAAASGAVYITYITQAWKDVWDNLVQEETQATVTHVATLTNQAIAIQAICATGTTSSNCPLMDDKDDTAATGEVLVNMTSTTKTLTFYATDAVTSCVVTYIKKPSSGFLYNRFIAEEGLSAASNVCTTAYPILIWGYSGQLPENGAVTERFISLGGTAGTGEAKLDLMYHTTRIIGHSITTGTGMYVWGRPWEINKVPLEVPNGSNLSTLRVKGLFIGI